MRDLPRGTQVVDPRSSIAFAYGAVTLFGPPFQACSTSDRVSDSAEVLPDLEIDSYNPHSETAATYRAE